MPKDIKVKQMDPLAERLSNVGMEGGASKKISKPKNLSKQDKSVLSKEGKSALRAVVKKKLKSDKQTMASGKRGDFGSPMMSIAVAKKLKASNKEDLLKSELKYPDPVRFFPKETRKGVKEAEKYLKKKKIEYRKQAEFFKKRGLSTGGLISGKPKLAKRGWK
jgi:hypothetical protein